jgi:hypothetical protein
MEQPYSCPCPSGLFGNGFFPANRSLPDFVVRQMNFSCNDIFECENPLLNDCDFNSTCIDTPGSFRCQCNVGFYGTGIRNISSPTPSCLNVDECTNLTHNCAPNATCADNVGSFACTCDKGFVGNGTYCEDLNECATGVHNCANGTATCSNIVGSFLCTCKRGFNGTGTWCADINECVDLAPDNSTLHNCDVNANCTNLFGSFVCACNVGWADAPVANALPVAPSFNGTDYVIINGSIYEAINSTDYTEVNGTIYMIVNGTDYIPVNDTDFMVINGTVYKFINYTDNSASATNMADAVANGTVCLDINECTLGLCPAVTT